jgi:tetratricopeptide (TPR) repeat protein
MHLPFDAMPHPAALRFALAMAVAFSLPTLANPVVNETAHKNRLSERDVAKTRGLASDSALQGKHEAEEAWHKGNQALEKGQWAEAEAAFNLAAKLAPKAYEPLLGLADVQLRRSNVTAADKLVQQAMGVAPKSATVLAVAGRLAAAQGRLPEAERQFQQAVRNDARYAPALLDLGELQLSQGKAKDAAASFRQASQADPQHPAAAFGLGRALAAQRDLPGALKAFEQSSALAPRNPLPLLAGAEVLAAQRQWDRALDMARQAESVDPAFARARLMVIDVQAGAARWPAAQQDYERYAASSKAEDAAALHMKWGNLMESQGRIPEAMSAYRKASEADGRLAAAWNNMAWLAARQQTELGAALEWARKAVALEPRSFGFLDTLAAVQLASGDAEAALGSIQQAQKLAPQMPYLKYRQGLALEKLGKTGPAATAYQESLKPGVAFDGAEDAKKRLAALGKAGGKT